MRKKLLMIGAGHSHALTLQSISKLNIQQSKNINSFRPVLGATENLGFIAGGRDVSQVVNIHGYRPIRKRKES